ncbi:unnamed protein product [Amoebophrya sp. A25]|nr:unnamed protein product [Amoebophrya sp. A25]|eukprot:GSA25T00002202001.1
MVSDGARIASRHRQGSSVAALLSHEPPKPLRDHQRANITHLRAKQRQMHENRIRKELDDEKDMNWKSQQWQGVRSRLHENKENASQGKHLAEKQDVEKRVNYLKRQTGNSMAHQAERGALAEKPVIESDQYYADLPETREAVPRRGEIRKRIADDALSNALQRNFIKENRNGVFSADMDAQTFIKEAERLKKLHGAKEVRKDSVTNVPEYLTKIKTELAQKKRDQLAQLAALQDTVPEGYKVLSEQERTETLTALRAKQSELETAFQKLPLHIESENQKARQREIQTKMHEIEDAVKMFQRPRVLVKIDC